jgi:DNA mismatch endonuclease (patch repair protein)
MSRIKSCNNERTELRLLRILRRTKICGWKRHQSLPGRPDFTFRSERVVVFVDGCFWHKCPFHCRPPRLNSDYWLPKLERNRLRDRRVDRDLKQKGWKVVRIWEHELGHRDDRVVVRRIRAALARTTLSGRS